MRLLALLLAATLAGCASADPAPSASPDPVPPAAAPDDEGAPAAPASAPEEAPAGPRVAEGRGSFTLAAGGPGIVHDAVPQVVLGDGADVAFALEEGETHVVVDLYWDDPVQSMGMRVTAPDGGEEIAVVRDGEGLTVRHLQARVVTAEPGALLVEPYVSTVRAAMEYDVVATIFRGPVPEAFDHARARGA